MDQPAHTERPEAVLERCFQDGADWILLIKELRRTFELDLHAAEALALSHRGWRLWCSYRFRTDARCRKMALAHLRVRGSDSLVVADGQGLRLRSV